MNNRIVEMTDPQWELVTATERFPAMVAGFGSGKTEALCNRAIRLKAENPLNDIAYYLPTYDLVATIGFPRLEEKLASLHIPYKTRTGVKPRIMIENCGSILFRTMDNPARIVGYEVGDSLVDELDTLKEKDARLVWQKIVARNRQKKANGQPNTIAVGTTPEGFRFVYKTWKKDKPNNEYRIIKASTYSNLQNLPADYIDNLKALYPANLIDAYIDGDFVNLTSGSVYPEFDRALNGCTTTVQDGEPIHIGQDFNVTKMASVIFVLRDGMPHAVDELVNIYDTPTTIALLKTKYPKNMKHVYPDASGQARKTNNASESDISLFQQEPNFIVHVNHSNPFVRDRVLSVNAQIHSAALGQVARKLKVNVDKCPSFVAGLEQQAYDEKGEPDKTQGLDHAVDAGGYFISFMFPVVRRNASFARLTGT